MQLLVLLVVIALALGLERIRGAPWNPVVGPKADWPWASPGLGVVAVLLGMLCLGFAQGPNDSSPDEGCLDICFVPSADALNMLLRDATLLVAAIAGIVGALALRDERARRVGVAGLSLAAVAAALVAFSI
jgi:hypothetical protein